MAAEVEVEHQVLADLVEMAAAEQVRSVVVIHGH
jgi:DNA-nicking Smr family endonuclease